MAAEGLSCLTREAVARGEFDRVEIGKNKIFISHLQFTNHTILLGKDSMKNVKVIKSLLRLFEIASGLKANFHKSSIHRVNMNAQQLKVFADLIKCYISKFFLCIFSSRLELIF